MNGSDLARNMKKLSRGGVWKDFTDVREHLDDVKRLLLELDEIFDDLVIKYNEDHE
jgi:hypothetical protein